ncbi:RNA-directed DNA polymerase, eukaryota, reverse transcriptase zinc-binding domain protein [Tanacetum coccineum]
MESMRKNFFNGVDNKERKISMIGWKKILASKKNGGLGVSSFFALNRPLIFKWIWRFISNDLSLWYRVIKANYGDHGALDNPSILARHSPWTVIICEFNSLSSKGINLHSFMKKKMGNGEHHVEVYKKSNFIFLSIKLLPLSCLVSTIDGCSHEMGKCCPYKDQHSCLDRLPTRFNLSLRGIDVSSILCPICSSAGETSSHLLFSCNMARQLLLKVTR